MTIARPDQPRRNRVNPWRTAQEPRARPHLRLVPPPRREADMGIRLVMEAAERHSPDLTWREKYVLIVLASSAIDATRECPPGIEDRPDMIRRLGLPGRSERYAVFSSLVAKGALLRLERGRNGVRAAYAIAPFVTIPGLARPGDPDAKPVDNPPEGSGNSGRFSTAKGPGSADEGSGFNPPKGPGIPDASAAPTSYRGIKGFKTGGRTPQPPEGTRPLFPFALPSATPGEGDSPEAENPAPPDHKRELVAEIRKARDDWSTRSIIRALEKPSVAEKPWPVVAEALRILAADPDTQHAGRLEHDGPWWAEARRRTLASAGKRPKWCGQCHEKTRLLLDEFGRQGHQRCPRCHPRNEKAKTA